eukprot:SAG31_NODE_36050_length_317_cov_0.706422_1_plen_37_part_01
MIEAFSHADIWDGLTALLGVCWMHCSAIASIARCAAC